jgi:hypothetical protein
MDGKSIIHADGVYFGLNSDEYHNDPALGSTDIRALLVHPGIYWWRSKMNPLWEPSETDWGTWGNAFHAFILEGEEVFKSRYYRGPSKKDFPDLLVTMEHLKAWLLKHGAAVSGKKDELIKRVVSIDVNAPIWDRIEEKFALLNEGKILLEPHDFDSITLSSKMITKNPHTARVFINGYPEVSIFWTVNDVRFKARIDYVRFRANADLKSFRNWRDMPMGQAIANAIGGNRLDVQAAHYLHSRDVMAEFMRAGTIFGEVSGAWVDRFNKENEQPVEMHSWVFFHADEAPISKRWNYWRQALYHDNAESDIRRAVEQYRRYREIYGEDIWPDTAEPHDMTTEDLPAYMGVG